MNDRPESPSTQGQATFARLLVPPVVAVCVIVILVAFGVATWWGSDSSSVDHPTLRESSANYGAAAGPPGAPASPSVQAGQPVPDDRSGQTGGGLPPAVEAARADKVDAETAALRANPPTLLDAMMRTKTEQGKPGQAFGASSTSSAASPFRHDQGGKQ